MRSIYEAFGRGDGAAILEKLHDDVEWELGRESAAVPWLSPRRGRAGAGEFFRIAGTDLVIEGFEVLALMADGAWVVALCAISFEVKRTGRKVREVCEPHVWRFDDAGRVVAMKHAADTLMHAAAV